MPTLEALSSDATESRPTADDVRAFRKAALENGYRLVPVETGGKRPTATGWTAGVLPEVLLTCREEALNTGILCEGLRIIDVDVDDEAKAAEIERLAQQHLPPGALARRRSNSPRLALVFRAAEGTPRKRKIGVSGRAVEVLGAGQQLVVHGVHNTGVLIEWDDGRSPATAPQADLPSASDEAITRFLNACADALGVPREGKGKSNVVTLFEAAVAQGSSFTAAEARAANDDLYAGISTGRFEELSSEVKRKVGKACLDSLDNTKEDPRDRWMQVVFAMHAAADEGCPDAYDLALEWSRRGARWTDEAAFDQLWNSYRSGRTGVGTLLQMAEQAGADLSAFWGSQARTEAVGAAPPPSLLKALSIGDLPATPPKREWLHGPHLIRGSVSLLVSPGGRGKSTFLLALALACASGRELLGFHVFGGPLRVLYINAEDSGDELTRRIRAAMIHHTLRDSDLDKLRVMGADRFGLSLMAPEKSGPTLNVVGWVALETLLEEERPDVLILDPLVSLVGGVSLNDNSAAALLQGRLVKLATQRKLAVMVAHHTAKSRETNTADAAMGAASFVNLARVSLSLETVSEQDAPKLGIAPWAAQSTLRLVGTKQNLSKPSTDDNFFRLLSVTLPNAAPPIYPRGDEVGVIEVFRPNPAISPFPKPMLDAALSVIRQARPPLSPKGGLSNIASAVSTQTPTNERQAKAIVDHLVRTGQVSVEDVSVPRAGRGAYTRQGLVATTPEPPAKGPSP